MANRKEEGVKKGGWTTCLYRFLTVRQTALVLTERGASVSISDLSAIVEMRKLDNPTGCISTSVTSSILH